MSFQKRLPDWFREDELVKTINSETEAIKLQSYYDILRQYVKQPLQLWAKYKNTPTSIDEKELHSGQTFTINNAGNYPIQPSITIRDTTCCTSPKAITGPIVISDGIRTLTINADLPPGKTLTIDPMDEDSEELTLIETKTPIATPTVIPFGNHDYEKLMQKFTPAKDTQEIELKFSEEIGSPTDYIYAEIWELDSYGELSLKIKETIFTRENIEDVNNPSILFEFSEPLSSVEHAIIIYRDSHIDEDNYYSMTGELSSSLGNLYRWEYDEWTQIADTNLYLVERVPVVTALVKVDGEVIDYNIGTKQQIDDVAIPFGRVGNYKKIMQKFTPTSETQDIKIKLGPISGSPDDAIYVEVWSLNNGILTDQLEQIEIDNTVVEEMQINNELPIKLSTPLNAGEEYALILHRTQMQNNTNYYSVMGTTGNSLGDFYSWTGTEWVAENFSLFFEEQIPAITGSYPTIFKSGTLSIGYEGISELGDDGEFDEETGIFAQVSYNAVSLETIYVRGMAFIAYPLKRINCYIKDTLIGEASFIKEKKQYCYLMKIAAEDIDPTLIEEMPFQFWAEISWHFFDKTIKKGFPQQTDVENDIFKTNNLLDLVAVDRGLFRRDYRTYVPYYKYKDTYPLGYPYDVEQDYCLEKRLLNEYNSNSEKSNEVFILNNYDEQLVSLKSRKNSSYRTPIMIVLNDEGNMQLEVSYTNELREEFSEQFTFENTRQLTKTINRESQILKAELIKTSSDIKLYDPQILYPEGLYRRYGLIQSEIFSYLGVIPTIKDMVDYCSIWDRTKWDCDAWGGDIYDAAVCRVDIPYPLPANFNYLSNSEINSILLKCKALGTHALSAYSHTLNQDLSLASEIIAREFGYEISEPISIDAAVGTRSTGIGTPVTWYDEPSIAEANIPVQGRVAYSEITYTKAKSLPINTDLSATCILSAAKFDTKNKLNEFCLNNASVVTYGSTGLIKINDATQEISSAPGKVWVENRNPTGWLWWTDTANINTTGYAKTSNSREINDPTFQGWPETDGLVMGGFTNINVPDDAIITGVKVTFSQRSLQPTQPIWATCSMRTPKGNGLLYQATGRDWRVTTLGSDLNTWGVDGLKGSDLKQSNFMLWFGAVEPGYNVAVDWFTLTVYFKPQSGSFLSTTIPATPGDGEILWGNLSHRNLSNGIIQYDILQENKSFGVYDNSSSLPSNQIWNQTLKVVHPQVCGVGLYSNGVVGTPTGQIKVTFCEIDGADNIVKKLATSSVTTQTWQDNQGEEIIFPIDLSNLDLAKAYSILIESTAPSQNNYCQIGFANKNLYNNGKLRLLQTNLTGINYNGGNADLCFNIYFPTILKSGIIAPVSLNDIDYENLKIRGKLFLEGKVNPQVFDIKVEREIKYV